MEFKELIYVVIFIGVAISSIVKSVKKAKKAQAVATQVPPSATSDVWHELMRELNEQQQPQPVFEPAPKPVFFEPKPLVSKYESQEVIENEAEIALAAWQPKSEKAKIKPEDETASIAETEITDAPQFKLNDAEELRKAVVYSEIFQRKYA